MIKFFLLILSLSLLSFGCKARTSTSKVRNLGDAEGLSNDKFDDPSERKKIPVLIYYLNESNYALRDSSGAGVSERESWIHLTYALKSCLSQGASKSGAQSSQTVVDLLTTDANAFSAASYSEYGIIRSLMSRNPRLKNFVFRNGLSTTRGSESFEFQGRVEKWNDFPELPDHAPEVYHYQPLMRSEVLVSALKQVQRLASPDKHRYILIAKSHGSESMAMKAFLAGDLRTLSQEQICDAVRDKQKLSETGDSEAYVGDVNQNDGSYLTAQSALESLYQLASSSQSMAGTGSPNSLPGMTKSQFAEALMDSSANMYFPIVVLEACHSDVSLIGSLKSTQSARSPSNISFIYTSDKGESNYRAFNYQDIFRRTNQGQDLQDVIKSVVEAKLKK